MEEQKNVIEDGKGLDRLDSSEAMVEVLSALGRVDHMDEVNTAPFLKLETGATTVQDVAAELQSKADKYRDWFAQGGAFDVFPYNYWKQQAGEVDRLVADIGAGEFSRATRHFMIDAKVDWLSFQREANEAFEQHKLDQKGGDIAKLWKSAEHSAKNTAVLLKANQTKTAG